MTTVKRKRYTAEFKQNAVQLVLSQGYSQKQAADSLGVSHSAIARWVTTAREKMEELVASPTAEQSDDYLTQIKNLQIENDKLRIEKDILKKAAVLFAEESSD